MSIAVWVGIIALAGLDAETGVVMPAARVGVATSFLLELLIYPAIFAVWKQRDVDPLGERGV